MPLPALNSTIVGHPSIQMFKKELENIQKEEVIAKIPEKLLEDKKGILGFIAGWPGDEDARNQLIFFEKCLKTASIADYLFIVTCHPRGDKSFEKKLFQDHPNVYVPDNITTNEMTVVSKLVINQKSTAGPKIATVSNVMFVVDDQKYTNPLIESSDYETARNESEFGPKLQSALSKSSLPNVFEILSMPEDSVGFLKQLIYN